MIRYARGQLAQRAPVGDSLAFVLSNPGEARDGLTLDLSRMSLDNFQKNAVAMWQHGRDTLRGYLPIGRWHDVRVNEAGQLVGRLEFDPDDAFAQDIARRYRAGMLSAVSISWQDLGQGRTELLEASAVAVPADPGALVAGRSVWTLDSERDKVPGRITYQRGYLPRVRSALARYQEAEQRIARDFEAARLTLDQAAAKHATLQDDILAWSQTVPRLADEMRAYVTSGQYRQDVHQHPGRIQ